MASPRSATCCWWRTTVRPLRFEGEPLPTLHSLNATGRVIYLGTLSKIFSPGVRVGWIHAPHPILYRVNLVKQANDLCTSTFAQLLALAFLQHERRHEVVARLTRAYRSRRDAMVDALHEFLPDATFTTPAGGLFLWATLADGLDPPTCWPPRSTATSPSCPASPRTSTASRALLHAAQLLGLRRGADRRGRAAHRRRRRERAALARALGPRSRRTAQ